MYIYIYIYIYIYLYIYFGPKNLVCSFIHALASPLPREILFLSLSVSIVFMILFFTTRIFSGQLEFQYIPFH
jgi:hypothetical protein